MQNTAHAVKARDKPGSRDLSAAGLMDHAAGGAEKAGVRVGLGQAAGDVRRREDVALNGPWRASRFGESP